jgi:hypothetical protein
VPSKPDRESASRTQFVQDLVSAPSEDVSDRHWVKSVMLVMIDIWTWSSRESRYWRNWSASELKEVRSNDCECSMSECFFSSRYRVKTEVDKSLVISCCTYSTSNLGVAYRRNLGTTISRIRCITPSVFVDFDLDAHPGRNTPFSKRRCQCDFCSKSRTVHRKNVRGWWFQLT